MGVSYNLGKDGGNNMNKFSRFLILMISSINAADLALATEPQGIDEFIAQQQVPTYMRAPPLQRKRMLDDFKPMVSVDPILDFDEEGFGGPGNAHGDESWAGGGSDARTNNLPPTTLEEELAAIMQAPKTPRPGHEIENYTEDQEIVLRYLFGSDYWNKLNHKKRCLRKMLPADMLLKLRLIAANTGKKAAVITHAYNAERTKQGRVESQDRQVISHFLRDLDGKSWLEYKNGVFIRMLFQGTYALKILQQETDAGRPQKNLDVQKAPTKSKKPKPNLTPEEKILQDISKPEYYFQILGVLEDEAPRSLDSLREALKKTDMSDQLTKKNLIKHLKLYMDNAMNKKWIEQVSQSNLYTITASGKAFVEPLRQLKQRLDKPEQVAANIAALPDVNLRNLRDPLMHFLVLKVASTQNGFITLEKFRGGLKAAYKRYTGQEMPDVKVRNVSEYTKKQTNDLHWFISRKTGVSLEYKVKPVAVEKYLDELQSLASPSFKKELRPQDPSNKRQSLSMQNDVQTLVEPDQDVQGASKKTKMVTDE
jgi:DNA-binding HxlR family transcriptional regulator